MQTGVIIFGAGVINGAIYVVGSIANGIIFPFTSYPMRPKNLIIERYNPEEDMWERVTIITSSCENAGVAVLDNVIYVVGGAMEFVSLDSCQKYDLESDTWSDIASELFCSNSKCDVNAESA